MVQTRENSPLCLSALRTRGGLSGPALKPEPRLQTDGGGRCWRESLPRASGPLAPVLGSPASVSRGGLVRVAQRPLRALVQADEMLCVWGGAIWVCAESQPTPPRHGCPSLQTEVPQGRPSSSSPFLSGKAAPGLRRPPGVGPCPPRCCLEAGPLPAMKRVQAQTALSTATVSDGRSFVQREPSGAPGIRARCWSLSLPNGGRDHPALHVQAGASRGPCGAPLHPGSHGPRSAASVS